jgi:hypothetical protein
MLPTLCAKNSQPWQTQVVVNIESVEVPRECCLLFLQSRDKQKGMWAQATLKNVGTSKLQAKKTVLET